MGSTANPERVLIHCLAGRGRTGTAISILNAMITLQTQMAQLHKSPYYDEITEENVRDYLYLSIFSIVRRVR